MIERKKKTCSARQKDLKKIRENAMVCPLHKRKSCARQKDFEKKIVKTHGLRNLLVLTRASRKQNTFDSIFEVLSTVCLFFTLRLIDALSLQLQLFP